jgi:hypothetical protein
VVHFPEKVGTGFPKENATNQKSKALSDSLESESALGSQPETDKISCGHLPCCGRLPPGACRRATRARDEGCARNEKLA